MRINIYAEELTQDVELVTKTVNDDEFGARTFYGLRFYLASAPELHHGPEDDDRSAVTVWVPWTRAGGHDFAAVGRVLDGLKRQLHSAEMTGRPARTVAERYGCSADPCRLHGDPSRVIDEVLEA